ncbi:MAG: hypothetical protein JW953_19605, partial [Anaerolineae bacterium]|nr:hypothetical protein [Anaerolineae bacterium]
MVKKLQRVSPQKVTTGQLPELTQNVREQVPTWLKLLLTKYGETEGRLVGLEAEPKPEEERIGPPPPTQEEESKLSNLLEQMAEEGLDVAPDRNVPTSVEWSSAAQPVEPPVAPLDDFLAGLGDTGVEENYDTPAGYEQAPLYEEHTPVPGAEVPDWLTDTGPEQGDYDQTPSDFTVSEQPSTAASPPSSSGGQEVPDWLTEALETPSSASEAPAFTSPSAPAVSDEEVPDWLTEALEETPDTALPVESQQFSPSFPPEAETPDWLTESPSAPEAATGPESSMPAETPAWLTETEMPAAEGWETVSPLAESTPDFAADIPDWQIPDWITEGIDEVAGPAESASAEPDIPDWIAQGETFVETDAAPESSEFPDWLTPLAETTPPPSSVAPVEEDIPDWLAAEPAAPQPAMADETEPDWLFDTPPAAAETSIAAAETPAEQEPVGPIQDIPGWLQNIQTEPGSLPAAPSAGMPRWLENIQSPTEISPPPLGQPPGWLENIQTTPGSQPPAPVAEQTVEPGPMMADADDWLTGLGAPPLDDTPVAAVKTPNLVESEDWLADFDAPAPGDTSVAEAAPSAEPDWFGDSGIALGPDTAAAPASQTGDDLTWPPETDLPPAVAFPEEETEESASGTRPASTLKRLKPLKRLSPKPASPTLPNWAASLIPATAETGQMPFALPDWAAQLVPAGASSGEEAATLLPDWAGALIPAGFETKAEETAGLAEIQEEVVLDAEAEMFSEPLPPTETRPEPLPPAEQEQDTLAWLTGLREALPSDEASTAYEVVEPGPEAEIEMPDWLTETEELPAEPMPEAVAPEPAIPEAEIKLPDWLMEEEAPVEPAPTEPVAEVELEIPDWLGRVEETPVEGEGKVEPETPPWLAEWPEAEQAEP